MKQVKLASIKDGQNFWRSKRNGSALYAMVQKKKGMCTITSLRSERTYSFTSNTLVWVTK